MKKKIFLWCFGIDEVQNGSTEVAGIAVQMSFWARIFNANGWKVYSLSRKNYVFNDVGYLRYNENSILKLIHLSMISEVCRKLICLIRTRPNVVLVRGETRNVFQLNIICRVLGIKLVFFGASDVNFDLNKDILENSKSKTKLYRKAIKSISYFVVQNQYQASCLNKNYGKNSIMIPQIWIGGEETSDTDCKYDAVWVANMRKLKRVEWVLDLADKYPEYKFAIIGGPVDKKYYKDIEDRSNTLSNVFFLGPIPFEEVNQVIFSSKVLLCTSEYEGFPNTFIQAWSCGKPVVTTVDPSNVVSEYNLGGVATNIIAFGDVLKNILDNDIKYGNYHKSVIEYFGMHHSAEKAYYKLIQYINE